MQTENIRRGNISSIINAVDSDDEVMSHLKWQIHENLNTMFIEYDEHSGDVLADITFEIITQWEQQHGLNVEDQGDGTSAQCTSILMFFNYSRLYDNHAWLTEAIAKRSNGAFVI